MSEIRRKLTWDEEIIAEHNKERGTRMKITEPDTPYAYGSDNDDDDEEEQAVEVEQDTRPVERVTLKLRTAPTMNDHSNEINAKLNYHKYVSDEMALAGSMGALGVSPPADKKKAFNEKRANHYNEFKVIQALRSRQMEDDEEDEGKAYSQPEEGDAMEVSRWKFAM